MFWAHQGDFMKDTLNTSKVFTDTHTTKKYCERRYFRAAKFSRIKLYVTFLRGQIFAHVLVNSI